MIHEWIAIRDETKSNRIKIFDSKWIVNQNESKSESNWIIGIFFSWRLENFRLVNPKERVFFHTSAIRSNLQFQVKRIPNIRFSRKISRIAFSIYIWLIQEPDLRTISYGTTVDCQPISFCPCQNSQKRGKNLFLKIRYQQMGMVFVELIRSGSSFNIFSVTY